jgi:hypothetical protein
VGDIDTAESTARWLMQHGRYSIDAAAIPADHLQRFQRLSAARFSTLLYSRDDIDNWAPEWSEPGPYHISPAQIATQLGDVATLEWLCANGYMRGAS